MGVIDWEGISDNKYKQIKKIARRQGRMSDQELSEEISNLKREAQNTSGEERKDALEKLELADKLRKIRKRKKKRKEKLKQQDQKGQQKNLKKEAVGQEGYRYPQTGSARTIDRPEGQTG